MMLEYPKIATMAVQKELDRIVTKFGPRRGLEYLTNVTCSMSIKDRQIFTKQLASLRRQVIDKDEKLRSIES